MVKKSKPYFHGSEDRSFALWFFGALILCSLLSLFIGRSLLHANPNPDYPYWGLGQLLLLGAGSGYVVVLGLLFGSIAVGVFLAISEVLDNWEEKE